MSKYLTVFNLSWQNEFVYRFNFVIWRIRNVMRLLMTYFLWLGIFTSNNQVFGYSEPQILTYVFLVLIVQTIVLSAPSADNIGGEISNGDLSNYLLKPVNYLRFWFVRDLSSKMLNISFAVVEISILWFFLRPTLVVPESWLNFFGFVIACLIAIVIYYLLNATTRFVAFWMPENTWGLAFLTFIFLEIFSGSIFPIDILPSWLNTLVQFTPFPYLIYFPIAIFVGKINGLMIFQVLGQSLIWMFVMFVITRYFWRKGLSAYSAAGR